jgi:hypothetical protein
MRGRAAATTRQDITMASAPRAPRALGALLAMTGMLGLAACGATKHSSNVATQTSAQPRTEVLARTCERPLPASSNLPLPRCTVIVADGERHRCRVGSAPAHPTPAELRSHGCEVLSPITVTRPIRRAIAVRDRIAGCLLAHAVSNVKGASAYGTQEGPEAADGVLIANGIGVVVAVYADEQAARHFATTATQHRTERHGVVLTTWQRGHLMAAAREQVTRCVDASAS